MGVVCSATDCKLQQGRDVAERQLGVLQDCPQEDESCLTASNTSSCPRDAKANSSPSLKLSTTRLPRCLRALWQLKRRRKQNVQNSIPRKRLAYKETLFEVEAPDIAAKSQAGQFLIVVPHEKGERVPLTICGYDAKKGTVSFAFHEVGKTTKELGCFNEGRRAAKRNRSFGQSV